MKGIPYSRQEFLFVYPILKKLWISRDRTQIEELKKNVEKARAIYHSQFDEMGVFRR